MRSVPPAARDGWRPSEEATATVLHIGGGVPAGQGVMPVGYVGVDGKSHSILPIETATWDPTLRQHDWDVWQGKVGSGDASSPATTHPGGSSSDAGKWECTPVGSCRACPAEAAHLPFCQPWGNRIEVECVKRGDARRAEPSRGWQQCGKDPSAQSWGFVQFGLLNICLGAVFLLFFLKRQQYLSAKHAAALNQRLNQR